MTQRMSEMLELRGEAQLGWDKSNKCEVCANTHRDARRHKHTHTPPGCLHTSAKTSIFPSQLISERPKSRFSPQKSSSKAGFIHPCRRNQVLSTEKKNTPAGQRKAAKERKNSPVTKLNYAPHVSDKKKTRFSLEQPGSCFFFLWKTNRPKKKKKRLKSLLTW